MRSDLNYFIPNNFDENCILFDEFEKYLNNKNEKFNRDLKEYKNLNDNIERFFNAHVIYDKYIKWRLVITIDFRNIKRNIKESIIIKVIFNFNGNLGNI